MNILEDTNSGKHLCSIVRVYDENDDVDIEIVTEGTYLFSIIFNQPRSVYGFSIEPGAVPRDKSLR